MNSKRPIVIGIAANRPGSGKTTVAESLVEKTGFVRLPLAEPLKRIALHVLREAGLSARHARHYVYEDRQSRIPILGVTGRHLLQTLGTEWGRNCISEDLWRVLWLRTFDTCVEQARQQGEQLRVVVDDVRFFDEAEMIRSLGGSMWMIERHCSPRQGKAELLKRFHPAQLLRHPGRLLPWNWRQSTHASEGGLDRYPRFDVRIRNDGTIHDLLMQGWRHAATLGAYPGAKPMILMRPTLVEGQHAEASTSGKVVLMADYLHPDSPA